VRTRERAPLAWARAQRYLGNALLALGEREIGIGRLEEAVTAYRATLEEVTREGIPLDWARTQMNLGNALQALGERESGTGRLAEAVAAWNACLEVVTGVWPPEQIRPIQDRRGVAQAQIAGRSAA
jgi:tetratricopeptide (TPR) repeat protein